MREAQFRRRITWTTFLFSVLVVMIHGNNIALFLTAGESGGLAAFVIRLEGIVSAALPTVAVPGFFMISAYLFGRKLTWEKLPGKMLRRVKSVLVPYIVWNSLYYFAMAGAGLIPGLQQLTGKAGVTLSLAGWADAVLHYRYNPVLWYMQQLIFLIALAPLIYGLMSRLYLGAAALLILFLIVGKGALIPVLNLDALLYYSTGLYLALHGRRFVERLMPCFNAQARPEQQRFLKNPTGVSNCLVKLAAAALGILFCAGLFIGSRRYCSVLLTVLYGILSPMVVWYALPNYLPEPKAFMNYNFFLYAYHFLLVRGINKAGALLLAPGAATALAVYLVLPFITILVNWLTAQLLKRYLPPLWSLLNGGR